MENADPGSTTARPSSTPRPAIGLWLRRKPKTNPEWSPEGSWNDYLSPSWQLLWESTQTKNPEWSPAGGWWNIVKPSGNSCSCAGTDCIGSPFPSDPASNAERGILATGHTRISIPSAQACTWRGHSSFADQRRHNTESSRLPVISPGSFGVELGARGCSRRWEGSSNPIG